MRKYYKIVERRSNAGVAYTKLIKADKSRELGKHERKSIKPYVKEDRGEK